MSDLHMDDALYHQLGRLAMGCRVLAMEGHDDISLGHLSLRDPEGRGVWLKRRYLGLDEIRGADDFILIDFQGRKLSGPGAEHGEWPIHTEIFLARPEVNVVGHTHPFYCCLFAATDQLLQPISLEGIQFGLNTPHFKETSDLINTVERGKSLARALGDAPVVFLKNHGVTYVGSTLAEAVMRGLWVEKAAKAQIVLNGSGIPWKTPEPEDWGRKASTIGGLGLWENFFAYYCRKLLRHEGAVTEAERLRAETLNWKKGETPRW